MPTNKTLKTVIGTTLVSGLAGSLVGAPVVDVALAAASAGGVAGLGHATIVPSDELELKDILVALAPTVVSTVVAGLTMGWPAAFVGLLTGPLASVFRATLAEKEPDAIP